MVVVMAADHAAEQGEQQEPAKLGTTLSVVEEPPCGEGEVGAEESGGLGQVDAQGRAQLVQAAGDAAVVPVQPPGGAAQGTGGAVGLQGSQGPRGRRPRQRSRPGRGWPPPRRGRSASSANAPRSWGWTTGRRVAVKPRATRACCQARRGPRQRRQVHRRRSSVSSNTTTRRAPSAWASRCDSRWTRAPCPPGYPPVGAPSGWNARRVADDPGGGDRHDSRACTRDDRTVAVDPQPEAFLPLVPPADLTDPPTTRPAAAVALWARDRRGPPVRFQLRNQARLDDRQQTWSARAFTDTPWMPATSSPRPGGTPWAPPRPRRMPPRRGRMTWRAASGLRRHRGVGPAPRRGHRRWAAAAAGRRRGGAAPVARHLPRLPGDRVRRHLPASERPAHRRPPPRPTQ
jgi:hypothetical protein